MYFASFGVDLSVNISKILSLSLYKQSTYITFHFVFLISILLFWKHEKMKNKEQNLIVIET